MDFETWSNTDLEFELELDRTKNDESRKQSILNEIQKRKIKSLENELAREKSNTPFKKIIKYSLAGIISIFCVVIVIIMFNMPSTQGYSSHADLITSNFVKAIPSGNINNIKTLLSKELSELIDNEESRNMFVIYRTLGEYKSNTNPVQEFIETTSNSPYISIATYHSVAQYEQGPADIVLKIAKISDTEFKLVSFNVYSKVFERVMHNNALQPDR